MRIDFYKMFGYLNWLSYILWLLELNVAILAVNLPLVVVLAVMGVRFGTLPVIFLAGMTAGPSLLAAFRAMPYIEDGVLKYYFRHLAACWKKCLRVWVPAWFLVIFLTADILILQTYGVMEPLKWGMVLLLLALTAFLLTYFLVWAAWDQSGRDAASLTWKLSFVKPFRFHLNLLILLGTVVLLAQKPVYLLFYGISLGLFLVYKNFVPVIRFVNERAENQ